MRAVFPKRKLTTLVGWGVLASSTWVWAGGLPPDYDRHSKDPCKNICVMARAACEDDCKGLAKTQQAACKAKCTGQQTDCKKACPEMVTGRKSREQIQKEDLDHERGLDKPGSPAPPLPSTNPAPPSLDHSGVGG